jgi:HEAT repeat protein
MPVDKKLAREKRGLVSPEKEAGLQNLPDEDVLALLEAPEPQVRSAAARILGERGCACAAPALSQRLRVEKALYARLAASEALGQLGAASVPSLIALLGCIGDNQHEALPERGFYKKSFPLPRDLAARTLTKVGPAALPALEAVIKTGAREVQLEALDALGWIAFYSGQTTSEAVLLAFYQQNQDVVLRWKILRAFQGFPGEAVRQLLMQVILNETVPALRWEAVRSLGLHGRPVPNEVRQAVLCDPDPELRFMGQKFLAG